MDDPARGHHHHRDLPTCRANSDVTRSALRGPVSSRASYCILRFSGEPIELAMIARRHWTGATAASWRLLYLTCALKPAALSAFTSAGAWKSPVT